VKKDQRTAPSILSEENRAVRHALQKETDRISAQEGVAPNVGGTWGGKNIRKGRRLVESAESVRNFC